MLLEIRFQKMHVKITSNYIQEIQRPTRPNWPKISQKSPPQDFVRRTLGIREELKVGKNEEEEEAKVLKRAKKSAAPSTPKSLFMRAVE